MPRAGPAVYISALHYAWDTLEEAFERAVGEFGLEGIEWSVGEHGRHPTISPEEAHPVALLANRYGATVAMHVWGDLAQQTLDEGIARLRLWLGWAQAMHSRHVVLHGGSHADPKRGLTRVTRMLQRVAPDFEQADLRLCLENHYPWAYHDSHELLSTPEEFLAVFDQVQSPAVGFCLDYGHSHMAGNTTELLRRLAPHLVYAHLADNRGVDDDHLAFGLGTVPWRRELSTTREVGFRGPFTVEFPVRGPDRTPLERCLRLLREVFGGT